MPPRSGLVQLIGVCTSRASTYSFKAGSGSSSERSFKPRVELSRNREVAMCFSVSGRLLVFHPAFGFTTRFCGDFSIVRNKTDGVSGCWERELSVESTRILRPRMG